MKFRIGSGGSRDRMPWRVRTPVAIRTRVISQQMGKGGSAKGSYAMDREAMSGRGVLAGVIMDVSKGDYLVTLKRGS